MATYTILTTRTQEAALKFEYGNLTDKTNFPTQASYFQHYINLMVSDPMVVRHERAKAVAFDQSFDTIPEAEQPAAQSEIEAVIEAHGGTVIPAGGNTVTPTIL